jgi:hypothetical protein
VQEAKRTTAAVQRRRQLRRLLIHEVPTGTKEAWLLVYDLLPMKVRLGT